MTKPRILTFVRKYLPGYRSGGPIRTIANMVDRLSGELEFWIVTADRDSGDTAPYSDVPIGRWTRLDGAWVYYIPHSARNIISIKGLMQSTPHDIVYLNSCFAALETIAPLVLHRVGAVPRKPTILAPRGELSDGALSIRGAKKRLYLAAAKAAGLHRDLIWQASSDLEAAEIQARAGVFADSVVVAPNLLGRHGGSETLVSGVLSRRPGPLRLIFLSRIGPKKNLAFLLRAMHRVRATVELSIVGPVDDVGYWRQCEVLISALPSNVRVSVSDAVPHERVREVLAGHDLFVLPTLNENFGHVIIEALSAETPVLVSKHTPWAPDEAGALTTLSLEEATWATEIDGWAQMIEEQLLARRRAAWQMSRRHHARASDIDANRKLFETALIHSRGRLGHPRHMGALS